METDGKNMTSVIGDRL